MAFSLADYDILGELGRGAFGTVLRARQKSLDRIVAIKCLMPQRLQDQTDIVRFRREAEALASLTHDNIITIYDYAFFQGNYYIAMEYIDGPSLERTIDRGLPLQPSLVVLHKVALALSCAHGRGIVHRDIKPANILLSSQGQVKLADFGLAAFRAEHAGISLPGQAAGTISYMAPEAMVSPKEADARVDIYALGCILYRVLCGRLPFEGESLGDVSYKVLNQEPAALTVEEQLRPLARCALQCLSKDRDQRPAAGSLAADLAAGINDYHAASLDLAAIVRGVAPSTERTASTPVAARKHAPVPSRALLWAAAAIVFALMIALSAVALTKKRTHRPRLPKLVSLQEPPTIPADVAEGKSGPRPITSTDLGADVATLVLRGMLPTDTLTINGKIAPLPANKRSVGVPLAPGPNRLEVHGAGGVVMIKSIEAMPLQVIPWDVAPERKAHGSAR
jgi:serine/threonine-protein kinase